MIFQDRIEAGKKLAEALSSYRGKKDVVLLGLARGGVVVAHAAAKELDLPFDVIIVRKIGAPDNPELALGAIAEKGRGIFNEELITLLGVSKEFIKREIEREREVVKQRKEKFLQGKEPLSLEEKIAILIDDGIATGASMKVAIESVKAQKAKKIVVAVPVAASDSLKEISEMVDEVICVSKPPHFPAVGAFYREFKQVTDEEILQLIAKD